MALEMATITNPAGEPENAPLRLDFYCRLKLEFHGSKVTSDAGLLPYGQLDGGLELTEMAGEWFVDPRTGKNGRHGMTRLLPIQLGRLSRHQSEGTRFYVTVPKWPQLTLPIKWQGIPATPRFVILHREYLVLQAVLFQEQYSNLRC